MKTNRLLKTLTLLLGCTAFAVRADVVIDWNNALLSTIRADRTPPPRASRAMAITHIAIYDAVNGIRRTHQPYCANGTMPRGLPVEAAAAAAAHRVLTNLFPAYTTNFDATLSLSLSTIPDDRRRNAALTWGRAAAGKILAKRAIDGSTNVIAYTPTGAPGDWTNTPPGFAAALLPGWGRVKPFAMTNGAQFRPPGPPPLNSSTWAFDYYVTQVFGGTNSTARTADETEMALFWADGAGTATPPGHWNVIAQGVAQSRSNTVEQNARLFALLNIAAADAAISCWEAKYFYNFWRPVTAIRNGDTDGNDDTVADPTWTPLIATPPFPEYTSGHSTFSSASAVVLARYCGTDDVPFATRSDGLPNVTRRYISFWDAAVEAGLSRIFGGIHFLSADEDALATGAKIGTWVSDRFLLPRRR